MSDIRHIVFDIGNVLIQWDPQLLYRRLIPDDAERGRFLSEVCTHEWNLAQDKGRSWLEAETLAIEQVPHQADWIRAWRRDWHEMIPGPIDGTVAVLDELLANGHDVTALTNFADDTFGEAVARFPFLASFRGVTVSARVNLVKPDIAIYELHAGTFNLDPASTLFFDDMPVNIEAARNAGWNAQRFVGPEAMRADLARYGVRGFA